MKILHFISGLPRTAGTTVFVEGVAKAQSMAGHDVKIVTAADDLCSIGFVPEIAHLHALWKPCNVRFMRWCQKEGYKYVVSVHGCLMPRVFAKSPLKKWIFYWLFLRPNLKKASAIHCTSEFEKEVCQKLGLKGPFIVAPIGIDVSESVVHKHKVADRMVLFLGRLGEEKGLINLLDAWKSIPKNQWRLVLAGPDWLGYKKILDEKISSEAIKRVEFTGPVYGADKEALYRAADIFVLPSPMENFSIVVLEALAHGIPAIATNGTPWEVLSAYNCGWWIDQGAKSLRESLLYAMSIDDTSRREIGLRGRKLVLEKYTWDVVVKTMVNGYMAVVK